LPCPYFCPTHRADDLAFPHPARLPLGAPWRGSCEAPGHEHTAPESAELESCNLGYAKTCARIPRDRSCDAVRFGIMKESETRISVQFVFEIAHLPAGSGILEYDRTSNTWTTSHSHRGIQNLAACFLKSFLEKKASAVIL
jgi:hypothetical protein